MPFSQIIPPSPSPTESKRLFYDTTLMAESEEELKSLLMKVKEENEKVSLKLNEMAKETQMYRTVFWTLWERERVG